MRFLGVFPLSSVFAVAGFLSTVSGACTGDKTVSPPFPEPADPSAGIPLKGGTPSANAVPLFYTFGQNSGAFVDPFKSEGLGGLEGADAFCNYEADAAQGATPLLQARKGLFKAIMSNRLTNAIDRFATVNNNVNGGIIYDVVDANNACLTQSVSSLIVSTWNMNNAIPSGQGSYASANAIIDNFTGTKPDWTKWHTDFNGLTDEEINFLYCSESTSATDQGWNAEASEAVPIPNDLKTKVGRMYSTVNNVASDWISALEVGCSNGLHLLCLQALPTPTQPGGSGDPQLTGLQGQQYQVHGMPDEYFNLISSPDMQLNSRFAYLASGNCNYNNTECWTHPGTYVDQLGFMFPGLVIKAIAGTHDDGMTVYVNNKRITPSKNQTHHTIHSLLNHYHHQDIINSTQIVTIIHTQQDKLIVQAPLFTITATNSDMFFNFGVSLHSPSLLSAGSALHHVNDRDKTGSSVYPQFPLHGLLGQTWKNARYSHGRMFAGTVDDYMLLDSKLISTKFVYNQYKH